jgi:hypothetical protein
MPDDSATRFLDAVCSLDAERVTGQLCEDARLSISRDVFACGKPSISKALKRSICSLNAVRYNPAALWIRDNVSIIDADVTCERLDGGQTVFPLTVILIFRNQLISDIRVFTYEPAVIRSFLAN